ncbi:hypothetical protein [Actinomadura terrae]|uniref:hypothetical protein n=1 Tax=Actinomadura terrae TaxID=604353 RepID=UPI001FA7B023|nr:hypothetical protein [Actinomadura terrae]
MPERPTTVPPSPTTGSTPELPALHEQAGGEESQSRPLQPILLLGLLVPVAAAICYPFRHRISAAAAGTLTAAVPVDGGGSAEDVVHVTYRPPLDPFAVPALGLSGSGAVATARVLALTALDQHGDTSLTVLPRSDATALFGLAEDELLDESAPGLFIPGNLDAALAYLETELSIRRTTGITDARRLLLVADCEDESERIRRLLAHYPGEVCAILLGNWTGEHIVVDDDGLFDPSPGLANHFPDRLPAMSRTEARDRLLAAIENHDHERRRPSGRRSSPKRN